MPIGSYRFPSHNHYGSLTTHHYWPVQGSAHFYPLSHKQVTNQTQFNPFQNYGYLTPPASIHTTSAMATPDADEMEHFQRLSDQYQANLPGPLIGNKKPLSELVTEYAQADDTYVVKTTALAVTHSTYRPIKGDGQCGWRGAVFGYFEILLGSGDLGLITQERVRLQSFEQTMRAVGIDYDIIIDMFDYTWELFDAIKEAIEKGNKNEAVLLDCMNDQPKSDSIVYHFKMMTSAFMRLQSERYEAFLEMPVANYCESRIDPANQEIDHIGLQALTDAVIAPAYIGLEVSYLDRSTGDEVVTHQFVLDSRDWPTIRLIYRPGHYDIIYKDDGPIQVLLQTETPQYVMPFHNEVFRGDEDAVHMHSYLFPNANIVPSQTLPGSPPSTSMHSYPPTFQNPQPVAFDAQAMAMQNSYFPPMAHMSSQQPPQHQQQSPPPPVRSLSMPHLSQSYSLAASLPATSPSAHSASSPILLTPSSGAPSVPKTHEYRIRYNQACYQYNAQRPQSLPLDAGSFGSSALSPAHFANADFQPQLWNAEAEYGKRD